MIFFSGILYPEELELKAQQQKVKANKEVPITYYLLLTTHPIYPEEQAPELKFKYYSKKNGKKY